MYCPNPACYQSAEKPQLSLSERAGIEIDYCPNCRGVWLDRGELDKLLERAVNDIKTKPVESYQAPQTTSDQYRGSTGQPYNSTRSGYESHEKHHTPYGKSRKKSLLSELFDF